MGAAKAFEVRRVRATAIRVWDRVVEIAAHRGLVTTGKPACQAAASRNRIAREYSR
jgi:hypothetical protein